MGSVLKRVCVKSALGWRQCNNKACHSVFQCKVLVVGAGAGGCSVSWRLAKHLASEEIIVLEPAQFHYNQPVFTLVGAGIKRFDQSRRPVTSVLPPHVKLFRDMAETFDPDNNCVYTRSGDVIRYEFMVVALGLNNEYDMIPGLRKALDNPNSGVSTTYCPNSCVNTWNYIKNASGGHVIFTHPTFSGKCSGAAQKIMYLADDYWRKKKIRNNFCITYNTGGEYLFGVKKYCDSLARITDQRSIVTNMGLELVEILPGKAVFLQDCGGRITLPFTYLHVTPAQCPPRCLRYCAKLSGTTGRLLVDPYSLRHVTYDNVYGIGDCVDAPNGKTAAAVACQSPVVASNLLSAIKGEPQKARYNGYGACPILTSYQTAILAEFKYIKEPCETMPFDQSKERRLFYWMQCHLFPYMYWNYLIKGRWDGPALLRKYINPFAK